MTNVTLSFTLCGKTQYKSQTQTHATTNKDIHHHPSSFDLRYLPMHSFVIPLFRTFTTSVKACTRFVSRSNLNLHEESLAVRTLRAFGRSSIDVFPCIVTSQHIIDLLFLDFRVARVLLQDVMIVWTCWATKAHPARHVTFFDQQQVTAQRTEVHGR